MHKGMRYFPVFLDLSQKSCLVVGAGPVGQRKISTLAKSSPGRIVVIDPNPDLEPAGQNLNLVFRAKEFEPEDVQGCDLVFACTGSPEVNSLVARICQEKNIWCNVARGPEQGDFILPAVLDRGELLLAVSTCGASPALSAKIKKELGEYYGPEYAVLTLLLSRVRKYVLSLDLTQSQNQDIFERLLQEETLNILARQDKEMLHTLLQRILPYELHTYLPGMTDDLF